MKKTQLIIGIALMAVALMLPPGMFAQNAEKVDKRALNHYTQEEIEEMPSFKIEQINFLFNESFLVPEQFINKINKAEVDVMIFTGYRKQKERVNIPLNINSEGRDGGVSELFITLLSGDELDEAFRKIKEQNQ